MTDPHNLHTCCTFFQMTQLQERLRLIQVTSSPEISNSSLSRLEDLQQNVDNLYQAARNEGNSTNDKNSVFSKQMQMLRKDVQNLRPLEEVAQEVEEQLVSFGGRASAFVDDVFNLYTIRSFGIF